MNGQMKYIMIERQYGQPIPILFPATLNHADMMSGISNVVVGAPISAGFVAINDDASVSCFGASTGLKLRANPSEDNRIISNLLTAD